MSTAAPILAFVGLGIALLVWVFYLADIAKNTVSKMPVVSIALQVGAVAAAAIAVARSPSALVIAPSVFALTLGGLFLFLITQRKTPVGDIRVGVGDSLLPFAAKNSDGSNFESASLAGRRILLKFFRGGW